MKRMLIELEPPKIVVLTEAAYHPNDDSKASQWPPWPALPDILTCDATREFMGLCYALPDQYDEESREFCRKINSSVIRHIDAQDSESHIKYGTEPGTYIMILWSQAEPNTVLPAQLSEVSWHYTSIVSDIERPAADDWNNYLLGQGIDLCNVVPTALDVRYVDEILSSFKLIVPKLFRVS